jgi:hypothetical protein
MTFLYFETHLSHGKQISMVIEKQMSECRFDAKFTEKIQTKNTRSPLINSSTCCARARTERLRTYLDTGVQQRPAALHSQGREAIVGLERGRLEVARLRRQGRHLLAERRRRQVERGRSVGLHGAQLGQRVVQVAAAVDVVVAARAAAAFAARLGRRRLAVGVFPPHVLRVGQLVVLLPLHAAVLEPDFDLPLGQTQRVRDLDASPPRQVAVEVELLLQF